jgi:beta-lactamase class A
VMAFDTTSGRRAGHRSDERFPICSTFKLLATALVLARVDRGEEQLGRRVVYAEKEVVAYSPVTKDHAGPAGLSVAELCEAAMTQSDNTAANLLLASFGGPAALTAYLRSQGDMTTRLDRIEPDLNEALPDDPRDTTTPAAMVATMERLLLRAVLSASSRKMLTGWLVANKTGDKRLRAGLPADWRVGDRTGTGANGTANDVAIVWPGDDAPILIAVYYTGSTISDEARNAVIAEAGGIVAASLK